MTHACSPHRRSVSAVALLALAAALLAGCRSPSTSSGPIGLDAVLWTQQAAERDALCEAVYAGATARLDEVVAEARRTGTGKPPAVVLDVDETVLDNSPYQAWLLQNGLSYTGETWDAWCQRADADPIPGAPAFLAAARARGVEIFYVTNRDAVTKGATYRNLKRVADPVVTIDRVLCKNERGWTGEKGSRWAFVEQTHDIVMMFGDNLGDFYSKVYVPTAERDAMVARAGDKWGRTWFVLPNPMYGSWERMAVEGEGAERVENKIRALRAYD